MIDCVSLHALFDGEAHECRREDDAHGRPVAAEELAERGVGQSDEHEREDRVHARFVNQRPVTAADFVEREALVQCVPAQGTQIRVPLELMGSDGIATTRVADSPLPRSSTVSIVLFWKLDN